MKDKKPAYLSVCSSTILFIFVFFNSFLAFAAQDSILVTTMNVAWYGSGFFPPLNDDEREGLLKDFFKNDLLTSDIILFQEITKPEQFTHLLDIKYKCLTYNDRGRAHQYVLTCFDSNKFEAINTDFELFNPLRAIKISDTKDRLRDVMFLSLKNIFTKKIIHTFNLHLKSGDDQSAVRQLQAEKLLTELKNLNIRSSETILIGGDFNSYIKKTSQSVNNELDTFLNIGLDQGFNFYTVKELRTTLSYKQKSFDHLLVDTDVNILDYSVHPICNKSANPKSQIEDFMYFKDNISDHCPVSINLEN